ncbi:MAG: acyltransferase [Rudaea sp.]
MKVSLGATSDSALDARNGSIDALRGLSILLVVVHHVGIRLPLKKTLLGALLPAWLLDGINWNGSEAVLMFFVISGFLITRRSQVRWGDLRDIPPRAFYAFRATRILPLLLLVVALLSILHLLDVPRFVIDRPSQSLGGAIAAALGFYLNWYEGATGYLPGGWDVLWSLSIEEVFYLAFPLVCLTLVRTRLFVPALLLVALSLPFTRAALATGGNEIWAEKAYLPGMAAIAIGVLAALAARRVPTMRSGRAIALALLGLAGIGAVLFAGRTVFALLQHGYGLLLALSTACVVLGAHWHEAAAPGSRLRGLAWLRSLGRLSYEIYLFHMFCVFAVVAIAAASGVPIAYAFVWYVPAVVGSWLLGLIVARAFSQPCERRLRALLQRAPARPDSAALGEPS